MGLKVTHPTQHLHCSSGENLFYIQIVQHLSQEEDEYKVQDLEKKTQSVCACVWIQIQLNKRRKRKKRNKKEEKNHTPSYKTEAKTGIGQTGKSKTGNR